MNQLKKPHLSVPVNSMKGDLEQQPRNKINPTEFERYSRQTILKDFGFAGQLKLKNSSVAIVGLGGLGSAVSLYLAASGVGELVLLDVDSVDNSNLQRQIVHAEQNIGMPKVESAKQRLEQINSNINIKTHNLEPSIISVTGLQQLVKGCDIIVDCTDNFDARYMLNKLAVKQAKVLISGAAITYSGQATSFDFRNQNQLDKSLLDSKDKANKTACYNCLFPENQSTEPETACNCRTNGILSPIVGVIGSIQATEAIKAIVGLPILSGQLLLMDSLDFSFRKIKYSKDCKCKVCG